MTGGWYSAGNKAGIDQVIATNSASRSGVAWVNVVQADAGTKHKWRALLVDGRRSVNDPVWPASETLTSRAMEVLGEAHLAAVSAMSGLQTPQASAGGALLASDKLGLDTVADSGRPVVKVVGGDLVLKGTRETTITASVSSALAVEKVFGVIVPPGYHPSGDAPVMNLPEVDLSLDSATGLWSSKVGGFSESGAPYTVLIQARDVWGQVSAPSILRVTQQSTRNRLIIFASGNSNWTGAEDAGKLVDYARESALRRHVIGEDIKVFADAALSVDDALGATSANLQTAIQTWSNADGQLGVLTIFLVGQGSKKGLMCANGDLITPSNLKKWLDDLQDVSTAQVQLMVDADYSGIFVRGSANAKKNRILISSTDSDKVNGFANGRWASVTNWIWNAISRGDDLRESYDEAMDLAQLVGKDNPSQFDDNGDGVFNKEQDGAKSVNAFVGSAYITADDPPFIWKASAAIQTEASAAARFYVTGIMMPDGGSPERVWGDLIGPDGSSRGAVELWRNVAKERYEGVFKGFAEAGRYLVFVQAGTQGNPSRTTPPAVIQIFHGVQQDGGAPAQSYLPNLTLPLDGRSMSVETAAGGAWRIDFSAPRDDTARASCGNGAKANSYHLNLRILCRIQLNVRDSANNSLVGVFRHATDFLPVRVPAELAPRGFQLVRIVKSEHVSKVRHFTSDNHLAEKYRVETHFSEYPDLACVIEHLNFFLSGFHTWALVGAQLKHAVWAFGWDLDFGHVFKGEHQPALHLLVERIRL